MYNEPVFEKRKGKNVKPHLLSAPLLGVCGCQRQKNPPMGRKDLCFPPRPRLPQSGVLPQRPLQPLSCKVISQPTGPDPSKPLARNGAGVGAGSCQLRPQSGARSALRGALPLLCPLPLCSAPTVTPACLGHLSREPQPIRPVRASELGSRFHPPARSLSAIELVWLVPDV